MRILFLDAYFEPEQIAFTHLEKDLLYDLVRAGHEVDVVCPTPTRGVSAEVAEKYRNKKSEVLYDGNIRVTRFSAPHEGRNPVVRALRYFWCNLRMYKISRTMKGIDVIFANSTPPTQGMLSVLVAKSLSKKNKQKVPFVFSLQDVFPDSLVNAKMTKQGSLIWKIGREIENFTYRGADKIIVIGEGFKQNIMEKGVPEEKIIVIPNWVDTSMVYPVERKDNILFERYTLDKNKFYICYSGNIGHSQNLELLVEAAKRLKVELPDMYFVLIGEGAAKAELEKTVVDEGIDNVIILPFQPYEDIAHVFSLGDAGLIISKPGIGGSSVPSKTWSIMAAERPIIASFDEDSELSNLVREQQAGVAVSAGDCQQLVDVVKQICSDHQAAQEMGKAGRRYLREYLDKDRCTGMYVQTIVDALNEGQKA